MFSVFQSFANLSEKPVLVDLTVEEGQRLKVIYGSYRGFHAIDLDTSQVFDIYIPSHVSFTSSHPCFTHLAEFVRFYSQSSHRNTYLLQQLMSMPSRQKTKNVYTYVCIYYTYTSKYMYVLNSLWLHMFSPFSITFSEGCFLSCTNYVKSCCKTNRRPTNPFSQLTTLLLQSALSARRPAHYCKLN